MAKRPTYAELGIYGSDLPACNDDLGFDPDADFVPANGEERIAAVKSIVEQKQFRLIDGMIVDLFSAQYISQVYDALNDVNKAKYRNLKVHRMAQIAFSVATEKK